MLVSVPEPESFDSCPTGVLEEVAEQLVALEGVVRSKFLEVIGVLRDREIWAEDGASSMAEWLSLRFHLSRSTAAQMVRVAGSLEELPAIRSAAGEGRMTWDQLRPLTRFATPEEDESLAERAPTWFPWELQRAARRAEGTTLEEAEGEREQRSVKLRWDHDRRHLRIWGRLPGAEGHIVEQALMRFGDALPKDPDLGSYAPVAQRSADALAMIAMSALEHGPGRTEPAVVVHADAEVLLGGEGRCEIECGPQIPPETARRLGCDARMQLVVEEEGRPIGIGRSSAGVPPSMRRVVLDRDGGCRVCGGKHWLEIHHKIPREEDGPTDTDNLLTVCWPHHRRFHEGKWRIHGDPDGEIFIEFRRGVMARAGPPGLDPKIRARLFGPQGPDG